MKTKKALTLLMTFIVSFWAYAGLSFAANSLIAQQNPLFKPSQTTNKVQTKLDLVKNLPNKTLNELTSSIIKILLAICGSLALGSFTVGGIIMITAQGDETKISKGKMVLIWSIAGLAVIAVSYGIVVGVSQLQFFGGGTQTENQTLAPVSEDLKPNEIGGDPGSFGGKAIKEPAIPK